MLLTMLLVAILVLAGVSIFIILEERRRLRETRPHARAGLFWDGEERRKFLRCELCSEVRYQLEKKPAAKMNASGRDISVGGGRLLMEEVLPQGTPLALEIDLTSEKNPVTAHGEVVWTREVGKEKPEPGGERIFESGIKFTSLAPDDESRLKKHLSTQHKAQ